MDRFPVSVPIFSRPENMRNLEQSRLVVVQSWDPYYWTLYQATHEVADVVTHRAAHWADRAVVKRTLYWPADGAVYSAVHGRMCARVYESIESLLFGGTGSP